MNNFLSKLKEKKILVSDGAWGTELIKKGFQTGSCPEMWNLEKVDEVLSIAESYINAGSDIISTNSFGASKIKLQHFGFANDTYLINKKAAEISRLAANEKLVMGSVGPTGKFLISQEITEQELRQSYFEQLQGLIDGKVDAILFETFYDSDELICGIDTLRQLNNIQIIASVTFNRNSDGEYYTLMGDSIKQIYSKLIEKDVDIVGVNCGTGFFDSIEIVSEIRKHFSEVKILVQPNAGLPEIIGEKLFYSETPDKISIAIEKLLEFNVTIIGGCCGTDQEHIKVIRNIVDKKFNLNNSTP